MRGTGGSRRRRALGGVLGRGWGKPDRGRDETAGRALYFSDGVAPWQLGTAQDLREVASRDPDVGRDLGLRAPLLMRLDVFREFHGQNVAYSDFRHKRLTSLFSTFP